MLFVLDYENGLKIYQSTNMALFSFQISVPILKGESFDIYD